MLLILIFRCAKPFSVYSLEKAAHVCNTAIVKKELADLPVGSNDEGDDRDEGEHKESIVINIKNNWGSRGRRVFHWLVLGGLIKLASGVK